MRRGEGGAILFFIESVEVLVLERSLTFAKEGREEALARRRRRRRKGSSCTCGGVRGSTAFSRGLSPESNRGQDVPNIPCYHYTTKPYVEKDTGARLVG